MEREKRLAEIESRKNEINSRKEEIEARKEEISNLLETRDAENTTDEEVSTIKEEVVALEEEVKTLSEEEAKLGEEATKLEEEETVAEDIARGNINATKLEKRGNDNMENNKELELLEQRGADLKEGKAINVPFEERAVTVSSGDLLVEKKYKREIADAFEQVSGLIDQVKAVPLDGGDSYSVAFEISSDEGDYTGENENYEEIDPTFDYVETGRAKITAYTEISKEATKLPNADYQSRVIQAVRTAIRKKLGKQLIVGAGSTNTITGIYNADTKVMPTSTGTADISLNAIDADTLNTIAFSYGGDEAVEGSATLILSKADLEAFTRVASNGKHVYKVTRNGQGGTIGYADGGVEVNYVINSACNSLSSASTQANAYTMVYGTLRNYEMPIFSDLEVEESRDANFKKGMIAYRGEVIVGGTVSKYNGFVRVKKGSLSL